MLSLSDTESGDCKVTVEVGDQNSGKAGDDVELGKCSSWDGDKLGMTELLDGSCSSPDELNIAVEVLAASSVTDSTFKFLFTFKTEKKQKENWLTN